jgi:hypothetical protein
VGLVECHHVVEALAAQGPDEAFHVGILPGGPRRGLHFRGSPGVGLGWRTRPCRPHRGRAGDIAERSPRGTPPRSAGPSTPPLEHRSRYNGPRVSDGAPGRRRQTARHRGHDEEVHGDRAPDVVVEERAPGRRRGPVRTDHVLGHRCLGNLDAQLLERWLFQVQKSLKPLRCHRITVAGWTTETASAQPRHSWDSRTQIE